MGSEGTVPVGSEGISPAGAATHEAHQRFPVMLFPFLPSQAVRLSHKGMIVTKGKRGRPGGRGGCSWPNMAHADDVSASQGQKPQALSRLVARGQRNIATLTQSLVRRILHTVDPPDSAAVANATQSLKQATTHACCNRTVWPATANIFISNRRHILPHFLDKPREGRAGAGVGGEGGGSRSEQKCTLGEGL